MPQALEVIARDHPVGDKAAHLALAADDFRSRYNRVPFSFSHNLHTLDLFSSESLERLCRVYEDYPRDYFISRSASAPGMEFYSVPSAGVGPSEAFGQLKAGSFKILFKRLEQHDRGFRDLLNGLMGQIRVYLRANGYCEELVRIESSVFISSPQATTPFHFDPEVNFFSQIEGEKIYHLYPPDSLQESELEPLYVRADVDIGQVDLARRDPATEHVFHLRPGSGLHQPQDAPHWVETVGSRSVSYTLVFETTESRRRGRVRAFNHYLRRLNLEPSRPGQNGHMDAIKSAMMIAAHPVKIRLGRALRASRGCAARILAT